jgi:hypothetical protein
MLSDVERIILWSAIEDFEDLSWLPGELSDSVKGLDRQDLILLAQKEVFTLLNKGFLKLYRKNINDPFKNESYIEIENQQQIDIINNTLNWHIDVHPERFYIAATEEGESVYYR